MYAVIIICPVGEATIVTCIWPLYSIYGKGLARMYLYFLLLYLCCWGSKPVLSLEEEEDELCPLLRASVSSQDQITGCYVVVLKKDISPSDFEDVQSKILSLSDDSHIYGSVQNVLKAITIKVNESSLEIVSWKLLINSYN